MTRETKIGLLVGLAFLIVLGVLISDHIVNSTEARPAPMASVAPDVARDSLTIPGGPNPYNSGNPVTPGPVALTSPITSQREFQRVGEPRADISVGPAPVSPRDVVANGSVSQTATPFISPEPTMATAGPGVTGPIELADRGTIMVSGPTVASIADPATPENVSPQDQAASVPSAKEYKAVAGDTVAKMARHHYGADTKANRDLIINANAALKADPRKVVVGKVYTIPVKPGTEMAAGRTGPTTAPSAAGTASARPGETSAPASERVYTVKAGDNIWAIAKTQLKDLNAVSEIRKLNRDVLKNGDNLKVGMKLKLPEKKTASTPAAGSSI